MARRILLHATGASKRLVRHLLAGRVLQRRMYATTPIPFLRHLHLVPEAAHFDALASALPTWWSSDPRFSPGFELPIDAAGAGVEPGWASDLVERLPPEVDDAPSHVPDRSAADPVVDQSRTAAARPASQAPTAPVSHREEPVAPAPAASHVARSKPAFYPPVQRTDRPPSASRRIGVARISVPPPAFQARTVPSVPASAEAGSYVPTIPAVSPIERSAPDVAESDAIAPLDVRADMMSSAPASAALSGETPDSPAVVQAEAIALSRDVPPIVAPSPRIEHPGIDAVASQSASDAAPLAPVDEARITSVADAAADDTRGVTTGASRAVPEPPAAAVAPPPRRARVQELSSERSQSDAHGSTTTAVPTARRAAPSSRPAPTPEPLREREGDRLFQPVDDGVDRSPAVWAARLARAMRPRAAETPASAAPQAFAPSTSTVATHPPVRPRVPGRRPPSSTPAPSASASPPAASEVKVSDTSRRFLKPLVGIDPTSVSIVQGPVADEINAAHSTDALAIGDDTILVGPDFAGERPRDLGLLAHELTHIARARRPRFIPPAARSARAAVPEPSEEAVARRVEARAIGLAHDGAARRAFADSVAHSRPQEGSLKPIEVAHVDEPRSRGAREAVDWGGLPAPWEPWPEWLDEAAATGEHSAEVGHSSPVFSLQVASTAAPAPIAASAPAIQPAVHGADSTRVLDTPEPASAAQPGGEGHAPVPPDLDQLARQVYAALKRRLEADARRERMFRG